jgi:hypothetical protein
LPGIEEEEAPTSTTLSHVNLAPAAIFWRRCRGGSRRLLQGEFFAHTSFTLFIVLLYFIYFTCIVLSKTQKN